MMTLITRKKVLGTKRIIASELATLQQDFYDEYALQCYRDDNEEHLYWDMFDCYDGKTIQYETYRKHIGLGHPDIKTFTTLLGKKLTELFGLIGANEFYIISHLKLDFFGNRDNKFRTLVN